MKFGLIGTRLVRSISGGIAIACAAGCATPVVLDHAVLAYDKATADSVAKQLLLNIARARHNQPIHFTAISNIAATYKFTINAGLGGALTGERGGLLVPTLGGSAEENPTVSISPMQGDEFTQRLLTPFQEQKLTLLLRQGYDVDTLLRLLGAEMRIKDEASGNTTAYLNRPDDRTGYPVFRRIVAHLSTIQDRHALQVEPLHFQYSWTVPAASVTPETFATTFKDFALRQDTAAGVFQVSRRVNGRVMISNFDPAALSNDDRMKLHAEAEEAPANDVIIDIRAGFVGGEYPLHGRLRLRSLHEVVTFIGRGIDEEPEFDVTPDPRTPTMRENPARTLDIVEARESPAGSVLSVQWGDRYYSVRAETGYQWNSKAFSMLYQLFQMSVAGVEKSGPAITIAK